MKSLPLCFAFLLIAFVVRAQGFVPKDSIIAQNVFQVEFSADSRSMVWCELIPFSGGKAKVWYADMDLNTGLPQLAGKQLIDTIQGQGWPYWGEDQTSKFFILKNQYGAIKYVRRSGFNTLIETSLGTVNADPKSLLNVSSDSTKPYFWINYVVLNPDTAGRDSLFAFRSDNPANRIFIASERKNQSGSAYELTFPRWLAQSELLAFPFRPFPNQPYWDMKFWDGATANTTQITNDIPSGFLNHHVDDLPFRLPQFPQDTFMFSSKAASSLAIYQKTGTYFTRVQLYQSPTAITPTTLTSFEPFTICGDRTYGAYQVYSGGGIPGNTPGEIYLKGIFNDTLHVQISEYPGDVAVDPEYVVGNNKVWIFYYGKPVGPGLYNLHRCETPLTIPCAPLTGMADPSARAVIHVFPNPFSDRIQVSGLTGNEFFVLRNAAGQVIFSGKNIADQAVAFLPKGVYFLGVFSEKGICLGSIKLLK